MCTMPSPIVLPIGRNSVIREFIHSGVAMMSLKNRVNHLKTKGGKQLITGTAMGPCEG